MRTTVRKDDGTPNSGSNCMKGWSTRAAPAHSDASMLPSIVGATSSIVIWSAVTRFDSVASCASTFCRMPQPASSINEKAVLKFIDGDFISTVKAGRRCGLCTRTYLRREHKDVRALRSREPESSLHEYSRSDKSLRYLFHVNRKPRRFIIASRSSHEVVHLIASISSCRAQ